MKNVRVIAGALALMIATVISVSPAIFAANNTNVTQSINAGSLTTDIRDGSLNPIANPTFALSTATFSFNCQTTTGTIGSSSQRLYVDNPGAANNGFTLTIAATDTADATWANGGETQTFDYNDLTGSGCTDGADSDSKGGQLTLDPSVATLTQDCTTCSTTGITKGSSAAFTQGTTDSVTLLTAAADADDVGRWYLTGIGVSQSIPAEQPNDSYTINFTVTVTAS